MVQTLKFQCSRLAFRPRTLVNTPLLLLEALDHADGPGEQWSELIFRFYAVDSDGDDSLVSQLNVTIGDDVQIS